MNIEQLFAKVQEIQVEISQGIIRSADIPASRSSSGEKKSSDERFKNDREFLNGDRRHDGRNSKYQERRHNQSSRENERRKDDKSGRSRSQSPC